MTQEGLSPEEYSFKENSKLQKKIYPTKQTRLISI